MIKTAPLKFPKDVIVTPETKDLIKQMLERDPEKRLDLMDFMETEYFRMEDDVFAAKV